MNNIKKLYSLVAMQMKDKIDFTWTKSIKTIIQQIVFSIVKFSVVFALVYLFLYEGKVNGLFYYSESIRISILIITVMFFLSLIQCTVGITESLYFSEDNKVLVTLPASSSIIFISKLLIFYFNELKKAVFFTIPIILACFIFSKVNWVTYIWMIIPIFFYVALPVLLGSLLSILYMFIKRVFNRFPIIEFIITAAIVAGCIYGVIYVIELIPEDIDLKDQWGAISATIREFLLSLETDMYLFSQFVYSLVGDITPSGEYMISWLSFAKVMILVGISIALLLLALIILKPIFFYMMTKNFEFNKKIKNKEPKVICRPSWLAFLDKEFKLKFRNKKFYVNYLLVYIAVPILILFLNKIFFAMSTNLRGKLLSYFFNFLLIVLPLLASNSKIASEFSCEGRSAYIKKTKPVRLYFALTSKLIFNMVFSAIAIIASCVIFKQYSTFTDANISMLGLAIIFFDYFHIFWAARIDLMNPLNEQYATVGNITNNKNENKVTLIAFVLSFLFAFISIFLIDESNNIANSFDNGLLRILITSLVLFIVSIGLYLADIKAFYLDK